MKTFKGKLIITCLIGILSSCANGQQVTGNSDITINIADSKPLLETFTQIDEIEFEESDNGNIPGMVTKLIVKGDSLFILDGYKSLAMFAYNHDGKLLFDYKHRGEAQDEYLSLTDMAVDGRYLYLLDTSGNKILKLDKSGDFVDSDKLPGMTNHILPLNLPKAKGSAYLLDMNNYEDARLLRMRNNKIDTLLSTPQGMENYSYCPQNVFQHSGVELLYMPGLSSVIYRIAEDGTPAEAINIDFMGLLPDTEFFKQLKGKRTEDKWRLLKEEYAHGTGFNTNSRLLLITFAYHDKEYLCFVDKASHAASIYDAPSEYSVKSLTDKNLYLQSSESDNLIVVNISSL